MREKLIKKKEAEFKDKFGTPKKEGLEEIQESAQESGQVSPEKVEGVKSLKDLG